MFGKTNLSVLLHSSTTGAGRDLDFRNQNPDQKIKIVQITNFKVLLISKDYEGRTFEVFLTICRHSRPGNKNTSFQTIIHK